MSHNTLNPRQRSAKVEGILADNYDDDREDGVVDILADLRHYCHLEGVDLNDALRISLNHFRAECDEDAP